MSDLPLPTIRAMRPNDVAACRMLWEATDGLGVITAAEDVLRFLQRNPQLSAVAIDGRIHEERIIAAVLCGHDGRRGYLYHLAVDENNRGNGVARALVDHALNGLRAVGIRRCSAFIYHQNHVATDFWLHLGWRRRDDLQMMAVDLPPETSEP